MRRNVGKELKTFEVERIIREPEREGMALVLEERLELDSARGQERFFRHVAALANTSAGHLAVGVAADRRPVGLTEKLDEG